MILTHVYAGCRYNHSFCMCSAAGAVVGISPLTCRSVRISWIDLNDATGYRVILRRVLSLSNRRIVRNRQVSARQTSTTLTELFESSLYSVEVMATDGQNSLTILNGLFRTMRCTGSLDNNNNNGNVHVFTILSAVNKYVYI